MSQKINLSSSISAFLAFFLITNHFSPHSTINNSHSHKTHSVCTHHPVYLHLMILLTVLLCSKSIFGPCGNFCRLYLVNAFTLTDTAGYGNPSWPTPLFNLQTRCSSHIVPYSISLSWWVKSFKDNHLVRRHEKYDKAARHSWSFSVSDSTVF